MHVAVTMPAMSEASIGHMQHHLLPKFGGRMEPDGTLIFNIELDQLEELIGHCLTYSWRCAAKTSLDFTVDNVMVLKEDIFDRADRREDQ